MAEKRRLTAEYGLDNNNKTITNVADPVNGNDVSTKSFSSNADNITTGTLPLTIFPDLSNIYVSTSSSQTANTILAAPDGTNGTPTFRTLVTNDIPNLDGGEF